MIQGTRLLKEFKNAKLVQRYLGHSDVATTLTPLDRKTYLTGSMYYVGCPPRTKIEDFVWGISGRLGRSGGDVGGKIRRKKKDEMVSAL